MKREKTQKAQPPKTLIKQGSLTIDYKLYEDATQVQLTQTNLSAIEIIGLLQDGLWTMQKRSTQ